MKRLSDLCMISCFLLILFAVPVVSLLRMGAETSYYENRALSQMPALNYDTVSDGSYFQSWEAWLTDHAAGRDRLLKLGTFIDYRLLRRPSVNGMITSAEALLPDQGYAERNLDYIQGFAEAAGDRLSNIQDFTEARGISFYYLGVPYQSSYLSDLYPNYLDSRKWHVEAMTSAFSEALQKRGISFINMNEVYERLGHPQEFYSLSDHHFTYYGAYTAYRTVLERINRDMGDNLSVLTENDLRFTVLPNPFMGSGNRKLFGLWKNNENLIIGEQLQPVSFLRWDEGAVSEPVLYTLPQNDTEAVSFNVYMGGDHAETVLDTGRPELPDLLIFGDSFTNPLETLLYTGFNVTRCLDLRTYTEMGILAYIEAYKPDVVICVRDDSSYLSSEGNGAIS